jgi:predicted amidohydrolase YtcJ
MLRIALGLLLLCSSWLIHASTLVHNVTGYTMNNGVLVTFSGMEYDRGRVTRLYNSAADLSQSKADKRINGQGATLLPGLIDAHGHIRNHGRLLQNINLIGSKSEADAQQRVKAFMQQSPEQQWIQGRGWNQVIWADQKFPTKGALDALSTEKFIVLKRVDGHAFWVNSAVLAKLGIERNTPDPAGGEIVRDASGEATGVLIDNAMLMVKAALPPLSDQQMAALLELSLSDLAAYGLTSTHDAETLAQVVRALQLLQQRDAMPIRIYGMLHMLDPGIEKYLAQGPLLDPEHMLNVRSVKISSDGALGSRGAALYEDYSDDPGNRGLLLLSDEQLEHNIRRSMQAGFQVNTHAIGDRANGRLLDFYEQLIKQTDSRDLRHRIEHAQILRVQDIPRLAQGGIIASIQPTHATSDKNMAGDRLGEARLDGAYAWKKLRDSGAKMAGGSDFPVESPNPFFGLHAAITRQSHDNAPAGGWLPGEKLSREQSLSLFTEDAAYAAHQEAVLGKLMPGYYADFILVRDDYFQVPEQDIWKNKVLETYVAGRQVYKAGQ